MPTPLPTFRRQQAATIATIYVAYATSMILRMMPTVAGTSIKGDESLGIGIDQWTTVLSAGTCGAMIGKFICGWAADKFGGHRTFAIALFVASAFVGLFAMSSSLRMFQLTFFITLMAQSAGWPFHDSHYRELGRTIGIWSRVTFFCSHRRKSPKKSA